MSAGASPPNTAVPGWARIVAAFVGAVTGTWRPWRLAALLGILVAFVWMAIHGQLRRPVGLGGGRSSAVLTNAAGQVELKLKTPWRDGTTHLVMSPLEFMQRLAALVPRPRLHLIRFHGVLAQNAKLRPLVVPQAMPAQAKAATKGAATAECEVETVQAAPHRIGWAQLLKRQRPAAGADRAEEPGQTTGVHRRRTRAGMTGTLEAQAHSVGVRHIARQGLDDSGLHRRGTVAVQQPRQPQVDRAQVVAARGGALQQLGHRRHGVRQPVGGAVRLRAALVLDQRLEMFFLLDLRAAVPTAPVRQTTLAGAPREAHGSARFAAPVRSSHR